MMLQEARVTNMNRGFTLIEVVIYVGLLTFLMTSVLVSTYPLFTGAERTSSKITADLETAFVVRKIAWALSSLSSVSPVTWPLSGATGDTLTVVTSSGDTLSFVIASGVFQFTKNGTQLPLTNERIVFSNLQITNTPPSGSVPRSLSVSFVADGTTVGPITYYARY